MAYKDSYTKYVYVLADWAIPSRTDEAGVLLPIIASEESAIFYGCMLINDKISINKLSCLWHAMYLLGNVYLNVYITYIKQ